MRKTSRWTAALALAATLGARETAARSDRAPGSRSTKRPAIAQTARTADGRVIEVRRGSREITVETTRGTVERIRVPTTTAIHASPSGTGFGGIRAGMGVHATGHADSFGRLVARELSVR